MPPDPANSVRARAITQQGMEAKRGVAAKRGPTPRPTKRHRCSHEDRQRGHKGAGSNPGTYER